MFINSNNSRKMHGLPLHRKKNQRKRFYTRCEAWEAVEAFLDYCDDYEAYPNIKRKVGDVKCDT